MTRITKAMKEQFKRYRKAYGPMTDEECLEMWDYDNNWCNSDEDAQEWLRNHMLHGEIEEKEIQERFAKKEKPKTAITKAEIKKISAKAKEDRAERLNILAQGLEAYDFLFGPLVEKTNTELKYIDPVTELPITIKISRHKTQKVVAKEIKRKPVIMEDGTKELPPLKTCSKKFLIQKGYNKAQIKVIKTAKNLHVHGINVSILLSSINVRDVTRIGDDEKTLQTKHMISSTLLYALSTLLLSIMAVKDIGEWGWMGLILTLFKVAYLFAGSYTSYFKGYDNITINLVNHFRRKIDILKMYLDYKPEEDT